MHRASRQGREGHSPDSYRENPVAPTFKFILAVRCEDFFCPNNISENSIKIKDHPRSQSNSKTINLDIHFRLDLLFYLPSQALKQIVKTHCVL